jgi:hypothetical protein
VRGRAHRGRFVGKVLAALEIMARRLWRFPVAMEFTTVFSWRW